MLRNVIQLLCLGCLLGMTACAPAKKPPVPEVTVGFGWTHWARTPRDKSATLSVNSELFRTGLRRPPGAGIITADKTIDGKQYTGLRIYEGENDKATIFEIYIRGENDRVLLRATSQVAFKVEVSDYPSEHLAWILSGKKQEGPIDLSPGQYEIEVVSSHGRAQNDATPK